MIKYYYFLLPFAALFLLFYTHSFQTIDLPEQPVSLNFTFSNQEIINGKVYKIIEFNELPNLNVHQRIEQAEIELLEFIVDRKYVASFPSHIDHSIFQQLDIKLVEPISMDWKKGKSLIEQPYGEWAIHGNSIDIGVNFFKNIEYTFFLEEMRKEEFIILKSRPEVNTAYLRIPIDAIDQIAELPYVQFYDLISPPPEFLDLPAQNIHKNNLVDNNLPNGNKYTGEGITIGIRDFGEIDVLGEFKGRLKNIYYPFSNSPDYFFDHSDNVAAIAGSAGNVKPQYRGVARGADFIGLPATNEFLDTTLGLIQNGEVLLTNNSFGTGCNWGYTIETQIVDQQLFSYPKVMHIFAAGNNGFEDCGLEEYGNLSGGANQAKNAIAVGNLFFDDFLSVSSSKGPTYDGRIKPDICAFGSGQHGINDTPFSGTSAAAPVVTGTLAQLYQAYMEFNNGETPDAALIKGALLNTATDLELRGPDYRTGWGKVNAFRALNLIKENRYVGDEISQDEVKTHIINVPAGTREVKIMTYWVDPSPSPYSERALVNDLNTSVTTPSGNIVQPWTLDPSNATTVTQAAVPGDDYLNNQEQVSILNPAPGAHQLTVEGDQIPFGAVKYYVTYEFIKDEVMITHPNGGEAFERETEEFIQWESNKSFDDFLLEYTLDDGDTWNEIAVVDKDLRFYEWDTPNVFTGQARIRITRGDKVDESDENFSIAKIPTSLGIEKKCPDYLILEWNAVPVATGYEVFAVQEKHMELIGTTSNTTFEVSDTMVKFGELKMFSVRAIGPNGFKSKRTNAKTNGLGLIDCNVNYNLGLTMIQPLPSAQILRCEAFEESLKIRVNNWGEFPITNYEVFCQINDNAPFETIMITDTLLPNEYSEHEFTVVLDSVDFNYEIKTGVHSPLDGDNYNDTITRTLNIYPPFEVQSYDFRINFLLGFFPPRDWRIFNSDNEMTWEANGFFSELYALVKNYDYDAIGEEDILEMIPLNLNEVSDPVLKFDISYVPRTTRSDQFKIEIYDECGDTLLDVIYNKSGQDLATGDPQDTPWFPEENVADHWRKEVIDLNEFIGQTILIRFVNVNGYGNNLYLRNVEVFRDQRSRETSLISNEIYEPPTSTKDVSSSINFSVFPNPNPGVFQIEIEGEKQDHYQINLFDIHGKQIYQKQLKSNHERIDLGGVASGVYFLKVNSGSLVGMKKLVVF